MSRKRKAYPVIGNVAYKPIGKQRKKKGITSYTYHKKKRVYQPLSIKYVLFLSFIVVIVVTACIEYLALKQRYTSQVNLNERLEAELLEKRRENDARLEYMKNSIDLNYVKDVAINKYGMHYPTEDQIIWYSKNSDGNIHVYKKDF